MKYFYHATTADRIPSIAVYGLQPSEEPRWGGLLGDWSIGKVFFTATIDKAAFYGSSMFRLNLEENGYSADPVLLRISRNRLKDAQYDKYASDDWFVDRAVAPRQLEIWISARDGWIPIQDVHPGIEELSTTYGEPGELDVDPHSTTWDYARGYIIQFWPKGPEMSGRLGASIGEQAEFLEEVPFGEISEEEQNDIINSILSVMYEKEMEYPEIGFEDLGSVPLVRIPVKTIFVKHPIHLPDPDGFVAQYARAMESGDVFPPVVVNGTELIEGHHRYYAAVRAGIPTILAWDIREFV